LLCGKRGIGKTSLAYYSIIKSQEISDTGIFLMPILVDASYFDLDNADDKQLLKHAVLQNIVRRLYYSYNKYKQQNKFESYNDVDKKILDLYHNAIAKEVSQETIMSFLTCRIHNRYFTS
jgi:hypothetical protein